MSRILKTVRAGQPSGEKPSIIFTENWNEEADIIADTIKRLLQKGLRPAEITLLHRTNDQASLMKTLLIARGLDVDYISHRSVMESVEVQFCVSIIKLIWGLKYDELQELVPHLIQGANVEDFFHDILKHVECITWHNLQRNLRDNKSLVMRQMTELINAACKICPTTYDAHFDGILFEKCRQHIPALAACRFDDRKVSKLLQRLHQLEKGISFYTQRDEGLSIKKALDMLVHSGDDTPFSITSRTVHNVKAMTFQAVFVCGLEEGLLPHSNAITDGSKIAIADERRVLYTAMSRAAKYLYVCSTKERLMNGIKRTNLETSYFLEDLLEWDREAFTIVL